MCVGEPDQFVRVRLCLLQLQETVAKHNAAFRNRFPHSHPVYKAVERSFFGVFNDIPIQIHAFTYAAEEAARLCDSLPMEPDAMYTDGVSDVLDAARSWAGRPPRSGKGAIIWKKSLSHIERDLAQEIGQQARDFFNSVYSLPGVTKQPLTEEERAFWARYRKLVSAQKRTPLDLEPTYETVMLLSRRLPRALCWWVASFVL